MKNQNIIAFSIIAIFLAGNAVAAKKPKPSTETVCGYKIAAEKVQESAEPGYSVSEITQEMLKAGAVRIVICSGKRDGWRDAPVALVGLDKQDQAIDAQIYPILEERKAE
ncbi:MAG: hypothetical protein ACXWQO_09350 [Bdellovibrionota bacterium]